ncbi:MAG TPA: hypothetical protein VKR32_03175 [Puia sp.]|nr:hypothetical protein [Puia sp.]
MKNILLYIIPFCTIAFGCSQKFAGHSSVNLEVNSETGTPMLLGQCTENRLRHAPFDTWYTINYNSYAADTMTLMKFKKNLHHLRFEIFMGTWCSDSRREVPRIFRILHYCGVKPSQVKLVMLDNRDSTYKQSPEHEERGMNIHRVPDLILFDGTKELGRIVESPVNSLEKDLERILQSDDYVPRYHAVSFLIKYFEEDSVIAENPDRLASSLKPICSGPFELNTYGYVLMAAGQLERAKLVFILNTIMYPDKPNVFDSLGEFFYKTGQRSLAKINYLKVLQLDPTNENARKMTNVLQ